MRISIGASLVLLAPLFVGAAVDAHAQSRPPRPASTARALDGRAQAQKPRLAGIAPAPAPAPPPGSYYRHNRGRRGARARLSVPVRITANGRVFANFGYGYEPVLRSCAAQYSAPVNYAPPSYSAPTYTPPKYTPPTYTQPTFGPRPTTQPAPAQLTESQRMARAATGVDPSRGVRTGRPAGGARSRSASCWTTNSQGEIVVYQP